MTRRALLGLGLIVVCAGVPLAWTRYVNDEYILPGLIVLCVGLLIAAIGSGPTAPRTALDRPLAAALLVWTVSTVFSIDPLMSLLGTYGEYTYGLWQAALCAALFLLAAGAEEPTRRRVLRAALASAMLVSGYAVVQSLGLDPWLRASELPVGRRAVSTLGTPVFLGAYLACWLPLALHWTLAEPGEAVFTRCASLLIGAGLLATVSRGAWLAAASGAVLYLALSRRLRAPRWTPARWCAVLAVAALAAAWSVQSLSARRSGLLTGDRSRIEVWRMAGRIFLQHPWLGSGPDTFEQALRRVRTEDFIRLSGGSFRLGHAHNEFLQILATTGWPGLAAFLWLLVGLGMAGRRALADEAGRDLAATLAAGLASLLIVVQFDIVSLPAFSSAALVAGLLCSKTAVRTGRLRAGALLILAAASTVFALRLGAADRAFKLARGAASLAQARPLFERSLRLNPCELGYHLAFVNFLNDAADKPGGPSRPEAVDLIAQSGATAVKCHPNDAVAHYIGGYAALLQAATGRRESLAEAEAQLDEALRLDPWRADLRALRGQAAALRRRIESGSSAASGRQ